MVLTALAGVYVWGVEGWQASRVVHWILAKESGCKQIAARASP